MRQTAKVLAVGSMIAATSWASISEASFFSLPRALKFQLEQISFITPALAPIGHTRFCLHFKEECETQGVDLRRRNIALTAERWNELTTVNREVNREIIPQRNLGGLLTEEWLVAPRAGDCHDYAVTKRHELLAHGWPSRSLLLSEVVTVSGEHHLVLVVRMKDIDLVLDNLNANVRSVALTNYRWVRVESPANPKFWSTVSVPSRLHTATLAENRIADAG
jgi:predicted transglutaminase-like cysteine proteinase